MDASVIIVTRNTAAMTATAIRSVLAGRDLPALEILVVDNGSTDDTPLTLPREFPPIQFIRSEKNLGFARAVNLAASKATGEFLLLLNSDAQPVSDALAKAITWMRANPACAVAGGQLLNPDGSRQNSIANFPTLATELLNKSLLRRLWPGKYPGKERAAPGPREVETVIGAFMLIRRSVWNALGGLDERYFFFFEETDFCLQARARGYRVMHLPDIQIQHGQGQTAKQVSVGVRIEYWRSRYLYFARHRSVPARMFLVAGLLLRLLVDWLAAGLCCLFTFGSSPRWRERWRTCSALVAWHLRGRPSDAGLPK